ncbi:hypothetical protein OAG1_15890 [Agarivorans sp. OAG1]|nr:hypothetical protein OAG1_15890 [Agarivorans sp. OAG1]
MGADKFEAKTKDATVDDAVKALSESESAKSLGALNKKITYLKAAFAFAVPS